MTPTTEEAAALAATVLELFNGGLVNVPDENNTRGFTTRYQPLEAMKAALYVALTTERDTLLAGQARADMDEAVGIIKPFVAHAPFFEGVSAVHIVVTVAEMDAARAFLARHTQEAGPTLETIASMIQWGDETFGPCTADKAISRAGEEWQEMIEPGADVPIEAADVIICLMRIPGIADAIQRKMTINRARKWRLMGDGTGYHIPVQEAERG